MPRFQILLFLFFCSLWLLFPVFAQDKTADSLLVRLQSSKNDTNKVRLLNGLAYQLRVKEGKKAMDYANEALALARKLDYKKGIGEAYWRLGSIRYNQSDYHLSLENYFKALESFNLIGDSKGIANAYSGIGIVYKNQGNFPKALENYFKSLKINEGNEDKNNIATDLGNIANVYTEQKDFQKAHAFYHRAIEISKAIGKKTGVAVNYANLGNVYKKWGDNQMEQGNIPSALTNFNTSHKYSFQALKLAEETGHSLLRANTLANIGIVYSEKGQLLRKINKTESFQNFNKAFEFYAKALSLKEELGNKNSISTTLGNIGSLYIYLNKFKLAEEYLLRALAIDTAIGFLQHSQSTYLNLSNLYDTIGNSKLALQYYKNFIITRDSIFNEEKTKKTVRLQMQYDFEKKEALAKVEQEKKDAIAREEIIKQRLQRNGFIIGFILVFALGILSYRGYRNKKKANQLLEHQKRIIEEKNKEITDSIKYASRIQMALITPERYISKELERLKN